MMNEMETRSKVVNIAVSHLGQKESDGTHRAIIDRYNAQAVLPRGYKVNYTDAWCATFVSTVAIEAGCEAIMPTECSCIQMVEKYKAFGRWEENDAYVPKPGDIVMYDWQDSGVGDNLGTPDHVGIVVSVSSGGIKVIEGNINNAVGYRSIPVNGRYIRGYCVPDYTKVADAPAEALSPVDITINNAISDGIINSPEYWRRVLNGQIVASAANIKALFDKYHAALN